MNNGLKQEIRNTYWLTHKIIMDVENLRTYYPIKDVNISKQKNLLRRYGTLENFYKNV